MMWQYTRRETKLLLLATLLVFSGYGLILSQNWQVAQQDELRASQVATPVGVLAAVPENEVNTLVQQLQSKEEELAVREAELLRAGSRTDTKTLALVTIIGAGLLGLILLNFYLDMRRRHSLA
jgi:uncharacterized iron-regulated membrane protein